MKTHEYDIIVCGGGVAGTCAAISAAREGADVLLIEQSGCLGGTWTLGCVSWIMDVANKHNTIVNEIMDRLKAAGKGHTARGSSFLTDPESLKHLLDCMCKESGVTVRLHTFVFDTLTENAGSDACRSLTAVCTASKSGKETFYAKYFIDATGDGDVCARSGAEFAKGNEQGLMQPMTMFALVSGPEYSEMVSLDNALEYSPGAGALPKVLLKEEICRAGITPSQKAPAMYHMFNNIYLLTVNHEYAKDGTNADSLTEATVSARDEINRITDALRAMGGKWQNLRLVSTASMIGVRESRRILGDYTVTKDHVREGTKFEDGLCNVTGGIDVHALTKNNPTGFETVREDTCSHDYQLPLRACKVKGFQNLLTAGRCISGDFYAHASYRLTGNMSVLGQKIGTYAAQMVRCGK